MPNPWIEHVRKYAKENNISYMCAITEAKASYVKKSSSKPAKDEKKNNDAEIKRLEDLAKEVEKDYDAQVINNFLVSKISGRRAPKLARDDLARYFSRHNDIIDKLEKLTNKKYDRLDSIDQIRKDWKKQEKRDRKAEIEKERLEKLKPPEPYTLIDYDLSKTKRKKKSIALL